MAEVISPKSLHVHSDCGTYSAALDAGVAQEVPDILVPNLLAAGAILGNKLPGEAPAKPAKEDNSAEKVAAITQAMQDILASGDVELLDASGIPKTAVIDEKIGFRSNKADREAAWANVEG